MSWFYDRFLMGPHEREAQDRLDEAHEDGVARTREEAERLSDAVWEGRSRDRRHER